MNAVYAGAVFGLLVATRSERIKRSLHWHCQCSCGKRVLIAERDLARSHSTSCGCNRRNANRRHGHTWEGGKSPTYRAWQNMLARCAQPSNPAYATYQRRGITVCERWQSSFENFLADMGERPSGKRRYTVERSDNDRGYEPGNCVWATWRQQGNNRSTNVHFTYQGMRYTLAELARVTGVKKDILRHRLIRSPFKWTVEGAVRTPVLPSGSHFCC